MERLEEIKELIVESHKTNREDLKHGCALPNRKIITEITTDLLEIIFPGYFTSCRNSNVEEHIRCITEKTFYNLKDQISRAIEIDELTSDEINAKAKDLTISFFSKLPKVIEYTRTDVEEAFRGDPAANDKNIIIATYPGIFATAIQRLAHELYLLQIPYIPRIMTEYAHGKTGIDIHPGAEIGRFFFIDHGTGVVIGETTDIGEHVKIYQGVTLGALSTKDGQGLKGVKRHPSIKNYVTIYSDASVLGGDTVIDDYVTIGGNAFITKSVSKKSKSDYIFDYVIWGFYGIHRCIWWK